MKPVDQLVKHCPERGEYSDCFSACIASLLEMPLAEVPLFCNGDDRGKWLLRANAWLARYGLGYIEYPAPGLGVYEALRVETHHIIVGGSPRFEDLYHAVIGKNGVIVHDPHPDKTGLLLLPGGYLHGVIFVTSIGHGLMLHK